LLRTFGRRQELDLGQAVVMQRYEMFQKGETKALFLLMIKGKDMLCLDQNHQACFGTALFETCLHKNTLKALRTT